MAVTTKLNNKSHTCHFLILRNSDFPLLIDRLRGGNFALGMILNARCPIMDIRYCKLDGKPTNATSKYNTNISRRASGIQKTYDL